MPILPVNQVSALSPGAQLWICPDLQNSKWTVQIDWTLNHILTNSEPFVVRKQSQELKGLLFENQIVIQDLSTASQDMLVACSQQLPAQFVLVAPWNGQIQKWCLRIHEHWKNLNYPSLRVFLPKGVTTSECSREWQKISQHQDFTVVLDKE